MSHQGPARLQGRAGIWQTRTKGAGYKQCAASALHKPLALRLGPTKGRDRAGGAGLAEAEQDLPHQGHTRCVNLEELRF